MADQASVRNAGRAGQYGTAGQTNGNGAGVVGSIADFGNDVATLFELQWKLGTLDTQDFLKGAALPMVVAAIGLVVVLGAVPVALLGVSALLAGLLGIAIGWAILITAALALAASGVALFLAVHELNRSLEPFRRSREELVRNVSWLRTVLVHSGRAYPRRGL